MGSQHVWAGYGGQSAANRPLSLRTHARRGKRPVSARVPRSKGFLKRPKIRLLPSFRLHGRRGHFAAPLSSFKAREPQSLAPCRRGRPTPLSPFVGRPSPALLRCRGYGCRHCHHSSSPSCRPCLRAFILCCGGLVGHGGPYTGHVPRPNPYL